jgi:hypothetical protein
MIGNVLKQAKEASISAVITRADGSVERLGVISYWHKNPLRRLLWRARKLMGI